MRVLSNLEFKNSTYILNKFNDFPENPSEGTVIFKENGLYIYSTNITSGNLEWLNILDFTRTNTSFKFEQLSESTERNITHNLNTQDLFVIVYDSDGNKQVESEIQFQSDNEIKLIFSEPISGKALLFGASVISSPSNIYTKEEIDELLKNIEVSGGSGNIILPENGTDGQVLIKDSNTESGLNWSDNIAGKDGKSAYEVAKDIGFEGTEEEWLKSLKGTDGISYSMFSTIDWDNPITLNVVQSTYNNYTFLTAYSTVDGYAVFSVNPTAAGGPLAFRLQGVQTQCYYKMAGNNQISSFVSNGDKIELYFNPSSLNSYRMCNISL